ncbi:MAG: 2-hydroxychromene-2-carboxylate isomerase [Alphaproteobacteria bacterium]|nr:2-hydroxychromene-2-carboxylate isomerase [Alphaproteobacteria bacterium]
MPQPVEFWFDFSSPYGYLAAQRIDAIAARHGRDVAWKPFLLGVAFKIAGTAPLLDVPLKGAYSKHDFARSARLLGVSFKLPASFPFSGVAASRAFYWLDGRDPALAVRFAKAAYHEAFGEGRDIVGAERVAAIAETLGIARADTLAALNDPAVKERLKREVDAGIAKGVFGSPYIIVDGEPFWGSDRLDQVDRWLATGGW